MIMMRMIDPRPNHNEERDMETRLKKLERLNRVLFVGLALALLPWVLAAAKTIPDLIEGTNGKFQAVEIGSPSGAKDTSSLIIKDSKGTTRIHLGFFRGHPSLVFGDKDGNVVATYAEKDGMFETVK